MRTLELFSGAGGLAKGLELAGFEHIALLELNKQACASLQANFAAHKVWCGDVREFDFASLENIDVVAGGPPCQPFSLAGKHQAQHDRRDMFPVAINAIETLAPRAFIFENVKGLLRPSFAEYFAYIILRLTFPEFAPRLTMSWQEHLAQLRALRFDDYPGIKYRVSYQLLNAADFGVPQTRERVVIVGVRGDIETRWRFPAVTHSEDALLWSKYVTGEYWYQHQLPAQHGEKMTCALQEQVDKLRSKFGFFAPTHTPWHTVRDALWNVPDPRATQRIADHVFRAGGKAYLGHTGSDYDCPAKTIKAGTHGVPGGENMIRFSDGTVRYLTIFEAKRLQTFPDEFLIQGGWGESMRQLGNAVPVLLAQQIGRALQSLLLKPQSPVMTSVGLDTIAE
jgi:DNA (cytosine-5)-methyltransferase 1